MVRHMVLLSVGASMSRRGQGVDTTIDPSTSSWKVCLSIGLLTMLICTAGCAPAISKAVRSEASPDLALREVLQDPDRYVGRVVIWSGTVLEARNTQEGTLLKVLQKPADSRDKPRMTDQSEGRFLALERRYLDPAIYSEGRAVTVAGRITGKQGLPQGEIEYVYPLLEVKELYLWPQELPPIYYDYPYGGYPYGYWHWWWGYGWGH
jgi:outer membrane lipoprotein